MKYSLQILKNRNLFKRHKYPSPNAWNIKMFLDHQLYKHLRVLGTTKLSNLNFKKLVCPKNVWMRHSAGSYLFPSYLFVLFGFFVFFFLLPYYFKIELEAAQSQLHLNSLQCISKLHSLRQPFQIQHFQECRQSTYPVAENYAKIMQLPVAKDISKVFSQLARCLEVTASSYISKVQQSMKRFVNFTKFVT